MLYSFTICTTDRLNALPYVSASTPLDFTSNVSVTTSTLEPVTSDVDVELFMPLVDMDTVPAPAVITAGIYFDDVE